MTKIPPVNLYGTQGYLSQYKKDPYSGYTNSKKGKGKEKPAKDSPFKRTLSEAVKKTTDTYEPGIKNSTLLDKKI